MLKKILKKQELNTSLVVLMDLHVILMKMQMLMMDRVFLYLKVIVTVMVMLI